MFYIGSGISVVQSVAEFDFMKELSFSEHFQQP